MPFATYNKGAPANATANTNRSYKIDGSKIKDSITQMNEDLKLQQKEKKEERHYLTKMSPDRLEKVGSQTLLDKSWAEQPLKVIKSPHKLTEIELYKALEKIVELPERRLKAMAKQGSNAIDEVFMVNIMQRIPQFLTATLVNLTKVLII